MTFLVTARKWRPVVFEDVVGQTHVTTTLRNAIATNRISHAYIFSGSRGSGKTTTARILAKAINCLHPNNQNPDNECEICSEIAENRSVNVFEIDGASNRGVDEIRNLRDAVRYGPAKGAYKVYIIDEVHMLTKEAFNALLKTLEEPPSYIVFIFATTEIHKVPLTILSRCQRFDFRRISIEDIIGRLKLIAQAETIMIEDDALLLIAKRADGSMRDAQSMLDQVVSFCGNNITAKQIIEIWNIVDEELYFRTTDLIKTKDIKGGLLLVDEIMRNGFDTREFIGGLIEHFRNILVARVTGSTALIETSEAYKKRYDNDASAFSEHDLLRLIKIGSNTASMLRWNSQPRLNLEVGILQMIKMDNSVQIDRLLGDLEELKKKVIEEHKTGALTAIASDDEWNVREPLRPLRASQPALYNEQRVSSFTSSPVHASLPNPSFLIPAPNVPQRVIRETTADQLSLNEAIGKWPSFIDAARKERIAVGTMLSETKIIDVDSDRLRIECPDDFHLDALKRNRQFLTELANRVYGAKIILETILAKEIASPSRSEYPSPVSPEPQLPANESLKQHAVVQALIKEFGAVIVE